jgi:hypothetical protein
MFGKRKDYGFLSSQKGKMKTLSRQKTYSEIGT